VPNSAVDSQQRLRALEPRQSFCVTAPAGSGKTELLIQRYLTLMARVEQPEAVLAITFTRKAAAEMRARINDALRSAMSEPRPEDSHSAQTWQLARDVLAVDETRRWGLLEHPARFNIKTIDSFCAGLTRQMPTLSGFGGAVSPLDDAQPIYREATRSLLDILGTKTQTADDLARLLVHFDGNWQRLEDLLVNMLACRDQWLVHMGTGLTAESAEYVLEHSIGLLVRDGLQDLASALAPYQGELEDLLSYSQQQLGGEAETPWPGLSPTDLLAWQAVLDMLLTKAGEWRKTITKTNGFPTGTDEAKARKAQLMSLLAELKSIEGLLLPLQNARHLPRATPPAEHWQVVLSVSRLLPRLAAQLIVIFQQSGMVDHSQISIASLAALGNDEAPTDLALKLDYRLQHILVDEFQDTAVNQYELIRRLSRGWHEHNMADPDNPRTLFIVGDGMQSIYGFRDADVGLFLRARDLGFNGLLLEPLQLTCNFRSDAGLVHWVNDTFQNAFPAMQDVRRGEISFSAAQATQVAAQTLPTQLAVFEKAGDELAEAQWICEQVEEGMLDDDCKSIAVLVRTRNHLHVLVQQLKFRGIEWQAQDIDLLASSLLVKDLQTLCHALHNHSDRVAWLALLRAPWSGLGLADLLCISQQSAERTIWDCICNADSLTDLTMAGAQRLAQVGLVLQQSLLWRERLGLRDWIESTWLSLGGPGCAESAAQLVDAQAFLGLLEALDNEGEAYDQELLGRQVGKLYAGASSGDSKLQLMTMHKAKGLEFDWVIIPGLARQPRSGDRELLLWDDYYSSDTDEKGFLLAMDDQVSRGDASLYNYLHRQRKLKSDQESIRLLYVAVTRAAKRLFLSASLQRDDASGEWKAPSSSSLLACIWDSYQTDMDMPVSPAAPITTVADGSVTLTRLLQLPDFKAGVSSEQGAGPAAISETTSNSVAMHIGSLIHLTLQRLASTDSTDLAKLQLSSYRSWWKGQLLALHVAEVDIEGALLSVESSVATVLADERGRWLLSPEREQAHCEYHLSSLNEEGRLVEHIIDRTYVEDKVRWVVDYKSSVPDSGQTLDHFLALEVETYRAQLLRYRNAFTALQTLPVKTALYFTSIPFWLEIEE
jgi:ATP-dependent helicase/nuclease subunit A